MRGFDQALNLLAGHIHTGTQAELGLVYLRAAPEMPLACRAQVRSESGTETAALSGEAYSLAELVSRRREPMRVADLRAQGATTGNVTGGSLVAAPVIHCGQSVGVLVVASGSSGHFGNDAVDALTTTSAEIAERLARALARESSKRAGELGTEGDRVYAGASGAPGVAIGRIAVAGPVDLAEVPDRKTRNIAAEVQAVYTAISNLRAELEHFQTSSQFNTLDSEVRAIFDVYRQLLGEVGLVDEIIALVQKGSWAQGSVRTVIEEKAAVFEQLEDNYLRARAEDFREIGRRILHHLDSTDRQPHAYPEECILCGDEIGIVEIAQVPRDRLHGIVSRRGSVISHAAVLARALDVPAVMGLTDLSLAALDGRDVVVDGHVGKLIVAPSAGTLERYRAASREEASIVARLATLRAEPAVTTDGVRFQMFAKAGMIADLEHLCATEVEGIGLYRTEFTFMTRSSFPSEDEQEQTYREVLQAMAPRPVTIRTLDAGGDKALPYFAVEESNPFLGWRGIRMSLDHPELFLIQVRAMLKANQGLGNLRIMFPMVASVDELDSALSLLAQARSELELEEGKIETFEVGVMVEVPSVVYQVKAFARRVDFISVGTNDLVQYLLAVDRDNARVANRYDTLHPGVINALSDTCNRALAASTSIGVCGEMAGELEAVLLFIGMGVNDLSASPARLPFVKAVIRSTSRARARELLHQALQLETGAEVRALLQSELRRLGLGELVSRRSYTTSNRHPA
jgi:phosphotransferase system enzyme I (PtsP)